MFLLVQLATHISKITARSWLSYGELFLVLESASRQFFQVILTNAPSREVFIAKEFLKLLYSQLQLQFKSGFFLQRLETLMLLLVLGQF